MITTERLILRQWTDADRAPFAALGSDPEVMRHFPAPLDREASDAFIDRATAGIDERGWGLWAVERDGEFLGFTGLAVPGFEAEFTPTVEIGWRFAREGWGHGYATEAARAVLRTAFTQLGLDHVVSFTTVANERSQAVMTRLGMRRVGEFEHPRLEAGHPQRPHVLFRLDRAHWRDN
jgi:RimJ/RimL family protein N-acetyltransferase